MNSEQQLWTPQFIIAVLVQFGTNFGLFILYSTIGIYATGMTSVELYIGIVTGVFTFAALFTRFFSGKMIKQFSCKPIIILGLGITLLSFLAYFFTDSIPLLIAVRIFNGLGHGFCTAALSTFISSMLPSNRLLEGLGYSMMTITLCAAIGPTVGLTLSQSNPDRFSLVFLAAFIVMAVTFLLALLLKDKPLATKPKPNTKGQAPSETNLRQIISLATIFIIIITFVMSLVHTSITACLNLYALENALGNMSLFFILFSIVNFTCRLFNNQIYRLFTERQVLIASTIMLVFFFIALAFAPNQFFIFLLGIPLGAIMGMYYPLVSAKMLRSMPEEEQGTSNNLVLGTQDVASTIGAIFWTSLAGFFGSYPMIYLVAALFSVLLLLIVLVYPSILKRKQIKEELW